MLISLWFPHGLVRWAGQGLVLHLGQGLTASSSEGTKRQAIVLPIARKTVTSWPQSCGPLLHISWDFLIYQGLTLCLMRPCEADTNVHMWRARGHCLRLFIHDTVLTTTLPEACGEACMSLWQSEEDTGSHTTGGLVERWAQVLYKNCELS